MSGKGSSRRPAQVSAQTYRDNHDRTFTPKPCEECDGTGIDPDDLHSDDELLEGSYPCHRCGGSGIEPNG